MLFVQLLRASERNPGRPRRIHTFHSSQRRRWRVEKERGNEETRVCVCVFPLCWVRRAVNSAFWQLDCETSAPLLDCWVPRPCGRFVRAAAAWFQVIPFGHFQNGSALFKFWASTANDFYISNATHSYNDHSLTLISGFNELDVWNHTFVD